MKHIQYGKTEIDTLKSSDPILGKAIDFFGHIKRPVTTDLFTALIVCIISQQIATNVANAIWKRFVNKCNGNVTPEYVITLSIEDIHLIGISSRKSQYILEIAKSFVSHEIDISLLKKSNDSEIISKLTSLPGIGVWTAEMIMMGCLERSDICSYNDLGIRRGIMRLYGLSTLSKSIFNEIRSRYSPYGSIASMYLWKIANSKEPLPFLTE